MAGTLDQEQSLDSTSSQNVGGSAGEWAQTFTAGRTGALDQVDLMLEPLCSGPAIVEIKEVDPAGAPTDVVLATENVAADDDAVDATFDSVFFAISANVVTGTRYAIALSSPSCFKTYRSTSDVYAAGAVFNRNFPASGPIGPWAQVAGTDFAFRTYVADPPPRSPQAPVDQITCNGQVATIVGTDGAEKLRGTTGDDVIAGLGGEDVVRGGSGDDLLCGGRGDDHVRGGRGEDSLRGGSGADLCDGGGGTRDSATSCQRTRQIP
jgi:hypothetical protein